MKIVDLDRVDWPKTDDPKECGLAKRGATAVAALPESSIVVDGEVVYCDPTGVG